MAPKYVKRVDKEIHCPICNKKCVKNGSSSANKQRFKCQKCKRTFLNSYSYRAYHSDTNKRIKALLIEGCGILSTSRLLQISPSTVQRRIIKIADHINKPVLSLNQSYEMDEMCAYVRSKSNFIWIAYAIRKDTKCVVDFRIGKRTNKTLRPVIETLLLSGAVKIYTDKLKSYRSEIQSEIHSTKSRCTNYIERKNLTLRTHLKRLSRRTICYSKSLAMLKACLTLYFWG